MIKYSVSHAMPFYAHACICNTHYLIIFLLTPTTKVHVFGIYGCGKENRVHSYIQKELQTTSNSLFFQKTGKYNWSIKYITTVPGFHSQRPIYRVILLLHYDTAQCTTHKNHLRTVSIQI